MDEKSVLSLQLLFWSLFPLKFFWTRSEVWLVFLVKTVPDCVVNPSHGVPPLSPRLRWWKPGARGPAPAWWVWKAHLIWRRAVISLTGEASVWGEQVMNVSGAGGGKPPDWPSSQRSDWAGGSAVFRTKTRVWLIEGKLHPCRFWTKIWSRSLMMNGDSSKTLQTGGGRGGVGGRLRIRTDPLKPQIFCHDLLTSENWTDKYFSF